MFDLHQSLFDEYGEGGEERVPEYIGGLLKEFANSPEAQPIREAHGSVGWAATMMDYGINHLGCTPATMSLSNFNEVVFDLFPRKVSTKAETAGPIVAELRAFWAFLDRQYGLENAKKILASLDEGAADRLRRMLADPANFDIAKSMVMTGLEAGFDMTTEKGLAEFQLAYNSRLLANQLEPQWPGPAPKPLLDFSPPPLLPERPRGEDLKKIRDEKKRQRQAKKRNRKK